MIRFVPQDIEGLVALFGSNATHVYELDYLMWASQFDPFNGKCLSEFIRSLIIIFFFMKSHPWSHD
jgi:hypothetical protein